MATLATFRTSRIEAEGVKCLDFAGDVTDEAFIRATVSKTADAFGGLHYAFNNAGVEGRVANIIDSDEAVFDQVIDVNVKGVANVIRAFVPAMVRVNDQGAWLLPRPQDFPRARVPELKKGRASTLEVGPGMLGERYRVAPHLLRMAHAV